MTITASEVQEALNAGHRKFDLHDHTVVAEILACGKGWVRYTTDHMKPGAFISASTRMFGFSADGPHKEKRPDSASRQ